MIKKHIFDARLCLCDLLKRTKNATAAIAACDVLQTEKLDASQTSLVRAKRVMIASAINKLISNDYTVNGKLLLDARATVLSNYKNALRELNQKRTKKDMTIILEMVV